MKRLKLGYLGAAALATGALLAAAGHYLRLEADPSSQVLENKLLERLS